MVGWYVHCWCLMTTHYHLLVVAPDDAPRVSRAMQRLNSVYAREFNLRHARRGHLFGARFTDTLVGSPAHAERTVAYILENPVRAGIVRRFEQWPWSGLETLQPRDDLDAGAEPNRNIPVRLAG
jgi:REP element-mobilizing transposase RayT